MFYWQYLRKNFKSSYFEEHLWTAASESFFFYVSLKVFLHEQITSFIESEDAFSKTKQKIPF